jgi:hypothetical protein
MNNLGLLQILSHLGENNSSLVALFLTNLTKNIFFHQAIMGNGKLQLPGRMVRGERKSSLRATPGAISTECTKTVRKVYTGKSIFSKNKHILFAHRHTFFTTCAYFLKTYGFRCPGREYPVF